MNILTMVLIGSGFVLVGLTIGAAFVRLRLLQNQCAAVAHQQGELATALRRQNEESADRIAELTGHIKVLEIGHQNMEAGGKLSRTGRSQVIELLRSGAPAEGVASTLGVATREVRLIAAVSRILSIR